MQSVAKAQSIVPAADGTGTAVTQNEQTFDINEGSLSADGENLFHSFDSFQPTAEETVNFLAGGSVQNIFARISDSQLAIIHGRLQVSGSAANLFLLNPAGIIFGENATLNLPAGFTATTADSIQFENGWAGTSDSTYAALTGKPQAFAFLNQQPGVIVNEGNLTLPPQQHLTLLGGTVVNTGSLRTAGGEITLAAIPGERIVRIEQSNQLLSLEISERALQGLADQSSVTLSSETGLSPLHLPALLTRSGRKQVSRIVANDDGTVSLLGSPLAIEAPPGTAIVSGTADVSNVKPSPPRASQERQQTGGTVSVLGDRISVLDARIDASGREGGGRIIIGGDYQGTGDLPRATHTFVGGDVAIAANAENKGKGGEVIVWSDDTTQYLGEISATGGTENGAGGFVEVSGKRNLSFLGEVDLSAANGAFGTLLIDPNNIRIVNGDGGSNDRRILDGEVFAQEGADRFIFSENALESLAGSANITLQANNNITLEDLADDALTFAPGSGSITWTADADKDGAGNIMMLDTSDTISASGRAIQFSGNRLSLGSISTTAPQNSGSITLQASDTIGVSKLDTHSDKASGGAIRLTAQSDITTGSISTEGIQNSGNVTIASADGDISTGDILTEALNGVRGNLTLSTPASLSTGDITASGLNFNDMELSNLEGQLDSQKPSISSERSSRDRERGATGDDAGSLLRRDDRAVRSSDRPPSRSRSFRGRQIPVQRAVLGGVKASTAVVEAESQRVEAFSNYFGRDLAATELTPAEIQQLLTTVQAQTESRSVVVYIKAPDSDIETGESSDLELLIFTAAGDPIQLQLPDVSRDDLFQTIAEFRSTLISSAKRQSTSYLSSAQQLYQWLIQPIEDELGSEAIDTILFSMDSGLRTIPIAALHDGEQFVIEKYSVGMVPSLGLMDTDYVPLADAQVLAMGASAFESLAPLPAVPAELNTIEQLWPSQSFLNETFTRTNLVEQQRRQPSQIIHLATHAEFNPGDVDNSYIQLWNERLLLGDIHTLGLDYSTVSLLVLSACRTALGDPEAEMGFAGLAVAAGVKSTLASLWSVSDVGTLALMSEFYEQLRDSQVKVEALRAAQLAMLNGDTRIDRGQLRSSRTNSLTPLPPALYSTESVSLSHPFYWSGFTMIGSPW